MFNAVERIAYLSKVAREKKELRLDKLYKIVKKAEFLSYAYDIIRPNKGSKTAGVDGITIKDWDEGMTEIAEIMELSRQLSNENYQPVPVRRVDIPKGYGKSGTRPLGIPALRDRVVQSACKLILEAIYKPLFLETSHGFRPKHSCQTAIDNIVPYKYDWVIEGDIKGCFDNIKHGRLLELLRKRIADERFIQLINKFLKSGYQMGFTKDGKYPMYETKDGTPQGGIVSPILANIYLHEFDKYMETFRTTMGANGKKEKVSVEYNHLDGRIQRLSKALKENKIPFTIIVKENELSEKDFKTTFNTLEELEKGLEWLVERRKLHPSKSKEYKSLHQQSLKISKAIKENKLPFNIIIGEHRPTAGTPMILKTRKEIVNKLREYKKQRKHVEYYDKEEYLKRKSLGYVRYADDFVILMGNYRKEDCLKFKDVITEWFNKELALTLSHEKTKITHATQGFIFLGYEVYKTPSRNGIGYSSQFSKVDIPKAKTDILKQKIKDILITHHDSPFSDVIMRVNRIISGWSNYFKIANSWSQVAVHLDGWLFWRLCHWYGRKHKCKISQMIDKHYKRINAFGRNVKRLFETIEDKEIVLRKFYDYRYTTPNEVAMKVWQLDRSDRYNSDRLEQVAQMIGQKNNGYSPSDKIRLVQKHGEICHKCGDDKADEYHVHHTRKVNRNRRKNFNAIQQANRDIVKVLLCGDCHRDVHPTNRTIVG